MKNLKIAIKTAPNLLKTAQSLAEQLRLPFASDKDDSDYWLWVTPEHLCIQDAAERFKPFFVDFLAEKITFRRKQATVKTEPLAQALGVKKQSDPRPSVIDATAGLAQDSFILASLGFEITLLERSPLIHALLSDGIARATQDETLAPIMQRLQLIHADAISYLANLNERPDIIYLDPMFPERKKSALSSKAMQLLQPLVGKDPDANQLVKIALACAKKRVVVKRPRLAEPLANLEPSYSLTGSSSRFDIYIIGT